MYSNFHYSFFTLLHDRYKQKTMFYLHTKNKKINIPPIDTALLYYTYNTQVKVVFGY